MFAARLLAGENSIGSFKEGFRFFICMVAGVNLIQHRTKCVNGDASYWNKPTFFGPVGLHRQPTSNENQSLTDTWHWLPVSEIWRNMTDPERQGSDTPY
ncbi:hypothetical protein OIU85_007684 [Salix viminalis]|uniref:Uncharacterized protein n=1 Tax=Salix viminalis TaxID=40686 RepID=A0A9Q0P9A0_SALVM|nr:hypothetical protein OIU85_007684 [Salix viminalis]